MIENVEAAKFGIRAAGRLIDYVPVFIGAACAGLVLAFLGGIMSISTGRPQADVVKALTEQDFVARIAMVIASWIYHSFCESVGGATLGKRLLGLEVVSEELQPATFVQGMKRNLAFLIDSLFFGMVAYHNMKDSPTQQRLGDRWSKTRVVMRRSLPPELRRPTSIFVFAFLGGFGLAVEALVVAHLCGYWLTGA